MCVGDDHRAGLTRDVHREGGHFLDAGAVAQVSGDRHTREQRRGHDAVEPERAATLEAVERDVRGGVAEVDAHTQRPGEADLVTEFQDTLELVGTLAGDVVGGLAGVEPLAGQPVAVEGEHTVEEGVPLLDRQGAALTVHDAQLIVQASM